MRRIITLCLCALCLCASSCSNTKQTITGYSRGGLPMGTLATNNFLYGKSQIDSSLFGMTHVTNLDVGFKYFVQAVVSLTTAYIAGEVRKVAEITQQMRDKGFTDAQINAAKLAAQTEAAKTGADLTKFGITNGLFKPEATTFVQP